METCIRSIPERRNPIVRWYACLITGATYYKVRIAGVVPGCATLIAHGIRRSDGKRMILGVSCALSEAEVHWREFPTGLNQRLKSKIASDIKALFNERDRAHAEQILHQADYRFCTTRVAGEAAWLGMSI